MKPHERPFKLKEIKIEVTYCCPLVCLHCSSDATPENSLEITEEKCLQILEEASAMGVAEVAFSGGEPMNWPGIISATKRAAELGIEPTIYTSGNFNNREDIFRQLSECNLKKLVFSLFGPDKETHEVITRVDGSFDKTVDSINMAIANGFNAEIHFVAMKCNYNILKETCHFAKSIGVNKISVLRFVPQGRGYFLNSVLDRVENSILRRDIISIRENGYDVRTGSPFNFYMLDENIACLSAIDRLIVGPDLRIYPCDAFKQIKAEEVSHTLEYSTLDGYKLNDCWNKSPFLEMVREYLTTDFEEPCKSCGKLEVCLSGCLAHKVIYNKDFRKCHDPMCLLMN